MVSLSSGPLALLTRKMIPHPVSIPTEQSPLCVRTAQKRLDIQGLRGVAIIAVILFHVNPSLCPRGFLGVDVFFVISGFLISTILSRDTCLTLTSASHFFTRRFSRIVPLYSLTLLLTLFFAIWTFAPVDLQEIITSTKWAALLARNLQQIVEARDYWTQAADFSPLLHTWSLSVEVQFYLVAPLLHSFISAIPCTTSRLVCTLTMAAASLLHYCLSEETIRFYSLSCRLWQFLLGFVAAHQSSLWNEQRKVECSVSEMESGTNNHPVDTVQRAPLIVVLFTTILVLSIWTLLLLPTRIPTDVLRVLITISTALLIILGTDTILHSNRLISFIGDISYELYLIHWPLIVFHQYATRNQKWNTAMRNDCLVLSIFIVAAKAIERFNHKQNLRFVLIIYSLILFLLVCGPDINSFTRKQTDGGAPNFSSEEIQSALRWAQSTDIYPFPPNVPDTDAQLWTNYSDPKHLSYSFLMKGTGNLSILLLGNSFAWRAASVIPNAFRGKFKIIRLFTELGCPILTWQSNCTNFRAAFTTVLERMKPDIVWVIAWEPQFFIYSSLELERQVRTSVEILKQHTKHLVIDGQSDYHGFTVDPKQEMIRRLQLGQTHFSDMQLSKENHAKLHESEWKLMRTFISPTVIFNNVAEQFCEADYCPFYNPRNLHQYYGDRSGHMNQEGLNRLRPGYREIAKRIIEKV